MPRTAAKSIDRFEFESALLRDGITPIAGVDEAGRGPLAGPVAAAAVIFPAEWIRHGLPAELKGLNDSKQLTEAQRERFFTVLTENRAIHHGIAIVEADVIDATNILQATHCAMNAALAQLSPVPAHVLVDGTRVKTLRFPQTPLVKGDSRSYSIAAASVLAKVTRDRLMQHYADEFPLYGFAKHKGYGTAAHLAAIARHGPCPIHRRSFAPFKSPQSQLR